MPRRPVLSGMNTDAGGRGAGGRGGSAYECIDELRTSDFSLTWHLSGPLQQHHFAGRNPLSESKLSFIIFSYHYNYLGIFSSSSLSKNIFSVTYSNASQTTIKTLLCMFKESAIFLDPAPPVSDPPLLFLRRDHHDFSNEYAYSQFTITHQAFPACEALYLISKTNLGVLQALLQLQHLPLLPPPLPQILSPVPRKSMLPLHTP
jgi:hypothetical protein